MNQSPQLRYYYREKTKKMADIIDQYHLDDIVPYMSISETKGTILIKVPKDDFGEFWSKVEKIVRGS